MFTSSRSPITRLLAPVRPQLAKFRRRPAPHLARLGIVVVAALAWRAYAADPAQNKVPIPAPAEQCAACHEDQVADWALTVHRRTVGAPQIAAHRQACAGCHSGIAAHLEDPSQTPSNPGDMPGEQASAVCLSCHKADHMMWATTSHSKLQEGCLTCHDPHNGEGRTMLRDEQSQLCSQCHPQQVAETRLPSHHPIPEGKMECADCHNVHGDERNNLPASSNSEMCFKCHAEKAGPFLHEHPPVTEDCTICHKPHGAQNDRLLRMDQPMLCLQCHPGHHDSHRTPLVALEASAAGAAQAVTAIEGFYNKCTSCHPLIHGTDLSSQTRLRSNDPANKGGTFMPGYPSTPLGRTSAANPGYAWGVAGLAGLAMQGDGASWGFSGIELGALDEDGNPTYVREYDGKNYEFPRAKAGLDQYAAKSDFHFRADGPAAGDPQAEAYFGSPTVSGSIKYDELTHRQPRFDDIEGRVDFQGNYIEVTDEDDGKNDYAINRKVTDINLAARHPSLRQVKWLAHYWRESESGSQQFLYMERCAGCHKSQVTQPIDRVTTELAGGAQIEFDKGALRYMHTEGRFENRAPETILPVYGTPPLAQTDVPLFGAADNKTRKDEMRAVALPTSALALNGLWSSKRRESLYNGYSLDIDTTGGGASWLLMPGLRLTASFFSSDFDNGVKLDEMDGEDAMSRQRDTTRAELRYSGLPRTSISAGFKREDVDRATEHEFVPANSKTDTWSAGLLTTLPGGIGLNVRYRKSDTDVRLNFDPADPPDEVLEIPFGARWIAPPTDEEFLSAVATYNITPQLLASAMYSKQDRSYNVSVPLPLLDVARSSSDDVETTGGELYYSAGRKTRLTAGYYQQTGDVSSDVTYGVEEYELDVDDETTLVFPPINALATFNYDAKILRVGGSHWLTPRLRLFGRYDRTRSDGSVIANHLGDYTDQDPLNVENAYLTLNPFDITLQDKWIGVGYLVDPFTEIAVSFENREWENTQDATQNGSFDLWRFGVRKKF